MSQIAMGSLFSGVGGFDLAAERAGFRVAWQSEIDKYASKVLRYRWPKIDNLGDINDIRDPEWVDILAGGFPCFPAGTLILTQQGWKPIESIEVGEQVLTHEGRWRSVTQTMNRMADSTVTFRAQGVPEITTTPEHPFYARRTNREWVGRKNGSWSRSLGTVGWVDADNLEDHHIAQVLPPITDGSDIDLQTWWVVGRYLGDGWTTTGKPGKKRVVICCSRDEADDLEKEINKVVHATRDDDPNHPTVTKFHITRQWFVSLVDPLGHRASEKQLTIRELSLPPAEAHALLEGYLSADGSHSDPGYRVRSKANTINRGFALSIALLAQRVYGVVASVHHVKTPDKTVIEGREVNQSDYWSVGIPESNRSAFIEGNYGWKRVRKFRRDNEQVRVYNIGVEEDESYIAEGAIVHNCQSYSVAGSRGGLSDDRGALWWQYHRLIDQIRPTWVVGENVPGLLSSAGGRDFETIIRSLADLGYGVVWSVLDSQYFGVAQRRRRVFIVGHSGGEPRPEILALAEGMFGHPAPSRGSRQDVASDVGEGSEEDGRRIVGGDPAIAFNWQTWDPTYLGAKPEMTDALSAGQKPAVMHKLYNEGSREGFTEDEVTGAITEGASSRRIEQINTETYFAKTANTKSNGLGISGPGIDDQEVSSTLDQAGPGAVIQVFEDDRRTGEGGNNMPMVFAQNQRAEVRDLKDLAGSLSAQPGMKQQTYVADDDEQQGTVVRRLTPLECERLQGFPDFLRTFPRTQTPSVTGN